ncbi:hypothetical protein TASIC1_0003062600 [Trichoderma asperellum]|uniref:Prion-inhibition and propagation HeLo domain-containing protein n=1 Tax=Trichoderma asperellum TaxID=101201 RepID=A0A6V8QT63_TRIAP|nr:hypothetical protein TASIC1_0003062600 [Trichoderma asperellum]
MEAVSSTASIPHAIFLFLVHAQKAREFEDEFERHQLRLDILQVRLSRQVEALSTIDSYAGVSEGQERSLAEILAAVQHTFFKAQRDAAKIRTNLAAGTSTSWDAGGWASLGEQSARLRALAFLDKRRVQMAKAVSIVQWVVYKREHFDRSIADIAALVADLERLANSQEQEGV